LLPPIFTVFSNVWKNTVFLCSPNPAKGVFGLAPDESSAFFSDVFWWVMI